MSNAKPIVRTGVVTDFGTVTDATEIGQGPTGAQGDLTYIPGWSEMRREHDLAKSRGETPPPLPVNPRWVRRTRMDGKPDNARQISVGNQGYMPVIASDVLDEDGKAKYEWITGMPPGSSILPDGTIGNADWVLMVADQKTAARNAARKTVKFLEQNTASLPQALEQAGLKVPGADPELTKELAPARR